MAKIVAVMDTDEKTLEVSIDEGMIDNISSACFEIYGDGDDDKYVEFSANSSVKEGKIYKNTRYRTYGKEVVKSKDIDVKAFINSKKSHKST